MTISRGRVVWENGRLDVLPGTSRYIHLPTHGPLFDGIDKRDAARLKFPYGETPVARPAGGAAAAAEEQEQEGGGGDEQGGEGGDAKEEL